MRVAFRADASVQIGTGHIMRCVTLAEALRQEGADVLFICCPMPGDLIAWLREKRYPVLEVPAVDAELPLVDDHPLDWLVVDHYGLDTLWEVEARLSARRTMVLDDLAERHHACDLLLDQNYTDDLPGRYAGLVPAGCQLLLGPRYALLRPEFEALHAQVMRERTFDAVHRILVFFGGTDPTGETLKALNALDMLNLSESPAVDVVVGSGNPQKDAIARRCEARPNTRFHCQVDTMAELMAGVDLAIGAGGTATWERLCLGLPAIVIAVADNQIRISREVAQAGAQIFLGGQAEVTAAQLAQTIAEVGGNVTQRRNVSNKALSLVDGRGVSRVLARMREVFSKDGL